MLRDLFGNGTATQDRIVWLEEELPSGDGGALGFTKRTTKFEKISAFIPVSEEIANDESQREKYLDARLPSFLRQAEDSWLVDRIFSVDIPRVRKLRKIFSSTSLGGLAPDALLFNSLDYLKLKRRWRRWHRLKHELEERNMRLVATYAVPRGMQIVGAFREGGTVWQLGELKTEISNSHQDYFRSNIWAARAEERLALTLFRPDAFRVIGKAA